MRTDVFSKETQQMRVFEGKPYVARGWSGRGVDSSHSAAKLSEQSKKCEVVIRLVHAGRG